MSGQIQACPLCGESSAVRPKLVLIDEAWVDGTDVDGTVKDPRLKFYVDLRVDDIEPDNLRAYPLEQFVNGLYCDRCEKGFVSEEGRRQNRRRYR